MLKEKKNWRNGTFLATAHNSLEADIWESKLRGDGIPVERNYQGAANAMEIIMGQNFSFPIDLYVPESCLEDAKISILPVPLSEEEYDQAEAELNRAEADFNQEKQTPENLSLPTNEE